MILILIIIIALLLSVAFSPLESLGWWAGWYGSTDVIDELKEFIQKPTESEKTHQNNLNGAYVIHLSGVGAVTSTYIPEEEHVFIKKLAQGIAPVPLLDDIFPYTVRDSNITQKKLYSGLASEADTNTLKEQFLELLINIRNILHFMISIDKRYGPIYNVGITKKILTSLYKHGYPPGTKVPIIIIGTSGGAQIGLGVSPYLKSILKTNIYLISIGGIFSDDPGFPSVTHMYHIYGTRDLIQKFTPYLCFGRWSIALHSSWNIAKRANKVSFIPIGPFTHHYHKGYFDSTSYISTLSSKMSYLDITTQKVISLITAITSHDEKSY